MTIKSIKRVSLEDIMYIVIFVYIFIYNIVHMSLFPYKYSPSLLYYLLALCRIYLTANCIYSNRHLRKKELIRFILSILICFVTWIRVDAKLFDIFVVVLTRKKKYSRIVNCYFYSLLISSLCIVCAHFMNILPQYITFRIDRQRETWGFNHANVLGSIVLILSLLYIYKRDGKLKITEHMIIIGLAFFCFFVPNSFTSTICLLFIDMLIVFQQLYVRLFKSEVTGNKLMRKLMVLFIPCIIIVFYGMVFNLNKNISFDINGTLLSRITQTRVALEKYGFSIWGQPVDLVSSTAIYFDRVSESAQFFALDCLFVYMPVRYGIIPSIYFLYEFINCFIRYIRAKNSTAIMICSVIAVYSLMETTLLNPILSFIFICAWADGYRENSLLSNKYTRGIEYEAKIKTMGENYP